MTSCYSVIQYCIDPIRDERINIAIVAFDEKEKKVILKTLTDWDRVENFACWEKGGSGWLQQDLIDLGKQSYKEWKEWLHREKSLFTVQSSTIMRSLLSVEELAEDAAQRYLVNVNWRPDMSPLEKLRARLGVAFGGIMRFRTEFRQADDPKGFQFLDVFFHNGWVAVEWKEGFGFGLALCKKDDPPLEGLFGPPDEVIKDPNEAYNRVLDLLQTLHRETANEKI